jgi:exopolysaccharide biosynthesis polyprenyl glycosylphosphotransferase
MEPLNVVTDATAPKRNQINSHVFTAQLVLIDFVMASVASALGLLAVAALSTVATNGLPYFWVNLGHQAFFPVGVVFGMMLSGNYRRVGRLGAQSTFTLMNSFFFAIGIGGLLSIGLSTIVHRLLDQRQVNANHVLSAIVLSTLFIPIARSIHRHIMLRRHPIRVVIVDSGANLKRFITHLELQGCFQVIGWIPGTSLRPDEGLGSLEELKELCATYEVDQVLIGDFDLPVPVVVDLLRRVQNDVQLTFVPRSFELLSWRSTFTELSGLPMIEAAPMVMTRIDKFLKRTFDLFVSSALLVILSPVLVVFAIIVATTSKGPVLYRQERVGRGGKPFTILKYRTMHQAQGTSVEPEAIDPDAPLFETRGKLQEDARITRPGRLLRRTGLDELPQLLNVFVGSMSIVGPRPFTPNESTDGSGWQSRRYEVRPGITGLWQVSGRNNLSAGNLEELDYLYVASWSLWWDVKILWDTPRTMVKGLGAF